MERALPNPCEPDACKKGRHTKDGALCIATCPDYFEWICSEPINLPSFLKPDDERVRPV